MFKKMVLTGLLLSASCASQAAPIGSLDLRYAGSKVEIEDDFDKAEVEGDGFDLRGSFNLTPELAAQVSYLSTSANDFRFDGVKYEGDTDLSVLRAGLHYQFYSGGFAAYVLADYGKVKLSGDGGSDDDSGFVAGAGLRDAGKGAFLWDVSLGYIDMGDIGTGAVFEYNLGYRFTPMFAAVLGGQGYALSKDSVDTTLGTFTLGLKLSF